MSALGQKRTRAVQNGMSALPPKADMCGALAHVRFVLQADMAVIDRAIWVEPLPPRANRFLRRAV